jgi:hypothetical protein
MNNLKSFIYQEFIDQPTHPAIQFSEFYSIFTCPIAPGHKIVKLLSEFALHQSPSREHRQYSESKTPGYPFGLL